MMDDKLVRLSHAISAAKTGADDWDGGCNIERDRYIEKAFADIPAVDAVEARHAEWKYEENYYDDGTYFCSACNEPWTLIAGTPAENNMNYCPNCGARMDGEEET